MKWLTCSKRRITMKCSCYHVPYKEAVINHFGKAGVHFGCCQMEETLAVITEPWQFTAHLRHTEQIKALISGDTANTDRTGWKSRLILSRTELCLLFFKKGHFTKSQNTFFTHLPTATQYPANPQGVRIIIMQKEMPPVGVLLFYISYYWMH